jgi:hypothetical protein
MSGIYTELAKRRAEDSNGPRNQGSIAPPPEKPVLQVPQVKKEMPASQLLRKVTKPSPAQTDSEKVEKYTTHIEPSLVKKVQIEAIEKDINDYDVVRIALKEYVNQSQNS